MSSYDRYDDLIHYNWLMDQVIFHESVQADALGKLLLERLNPSSVIDVGCGPGTYLLQFKEAGKLILGIDGAPAGGQQLGVGEFELVDLRNEWHPARQYDLAFCIEVAEHLRPQYAENLVRIVAECSSTIFWTAARPGQGGEAHWNEQDKPYWLGLFSKYGIGVHARNDEIMGVVNGDAAYDHCHWIKWNGVLLGKNV